jgi:hypothetical protein
MKILSKLSILIVYSLLESKAAYSVKYGRQIRFRPRALTVPGKTTNPVMGYYYSNKVTCKNTQM